MVEPVSDLRASPSRRFKSASQRLGDEMHRKGPFAAVFRRATDARLSPNPQVLAPRSALSSSPPEPCHDARHLCWRPFFEQENTKLLGDPVRACLRN
jgi:hypothetical protein